jgi:hypothetical protein
VLLTTHPNVVLILKKKQSCNFTTITPPDSGLLQVELDRFMWKMQYPLWVKKRGQCREVQRNNATDIQIARALCGTEKYVQSP